MTVLSLPRTHTTRADELRRLARQLGADPPYYLHSPRGASEPAPGWYWRPAGATHPQYLAHNHLEAYAKLRVLIAQQRAAS